MFADVTTLGQARVSVSVHLKEIYNTVRAEPSWSLVI